MESGKSIITQKTCKNDAVKLWNMVTKHVQTCKSLNEIKMHAWSRDILKSYASVNFTICINVVKTIYLLIYTVTL